VALVACAPPPRRLARIGMLLANDLRVPPANPLNWQAFAGGLQNAGWIEGDNLRVEWRMAGDDLGRFPELARELVSLQVDVIVTSSTPGAVAAQSATPSIPIVGSGSNIVGAGLAVSLAHPGRNFTGVENSASSPVKQLDLLKQWIPGLRRVAYVLNQTNGSSAAAFADLQQVARSVGVESRAYDVRREGDLDVVLEEIIAWPADALMVAQETTFGGYNRRFVDFAAQHKLPAMYALPEYMDSGGLALYKPKQAENWTRMAVMVDRILRGAKPSEIPVETPTMFDFVVNQTTAGALGLSIPAEIAQQVTEWRD
jgi:putative ABC transport system substrate-binding protein